MISSIRNCISTSFNHLVIHAKKLNPLTSRIKEYITHKFKNIADCFKDISFLRNRRFNSSNQTFRTQSNNGNVNQVATATLNPSQQPQSPTCLTTAQNRELPNRPEELGLNLNSSEIVTNQSLTLDRLNEALEVWENNPNAMGKKVEASQRIRQAFQNNSINLDLFSLKLNNLPSIIGQLTQLKTLNLGYNQLQVLPAEIGHIIQLQNLNLWSNKLQELPSEIGNLTQLEELNLNNNQLHVLPPETVNLTQIKKLNLCNNPLQVLPAEICQLTQLQQLDLSNNQFQVLPKEIGNLTQLQELRLYRNRLQALPAEIGQMTQLQELGLSFNCLQVLPKEIGNLTQLQKLSLNHNLLQALPAEIGNLTQLKEIDIQSNQNLAELPLSLGELSQLFWIEIDDTHISGEVCESILAQCKAKRRKQNAFIPRLQKWLTLAGVKDVNLDLFNAWDIAHQNIATEWLFRLERTQDFHGNQQKLAQVVCSILKSVTEDKTFRDLFMNQAEVNNAACQDRSAMALNELYTAWKIHLMEKDQTNSLQDKVYLSIQAAKTLALRRCLTDIISKREKQNNQIENESVEIFLYYETALKNELNLLSVIERMSYSEIGQRNWIDVNQLKKEVNDQYITYLLDIPAFISTARQDQSFIEQIDLIDAESHKKAEELGEYPANSEYSEEVLDWKTKMGEINEQHKQSRILMVKKWLGDQRLS